MRNLIAHFKERPKTAGVLLVVALIVAGVWWQYRREYYDDQISLSKTVFNFASQESGTDGYAGWARDPAGGIATAPMPGAPAMMYEKVSMPPYAPTAGATAADVDQKIIKTGSLDLLVEKVADASARVGSIATEEGGFVQSSSVSEGGDGTFYGSVVVRVPVQKFEAVMAKLRGLATLVRNESSNGQDVTEQYTDLEAQLRNAKAQEETYLEVLKQAKSVEDILKVQERLGMIRSQIESLEGRIQYLTNATSYSTISVSLSEEPAVRAPTKEFRPVAIIKAAFQALIVVFQSLIAGLIWVVIVWGGVLLPLGLAAWLVVRWWKNRAHRM